jgi:ComF family protein
MHPNPTHSTRLPLVTTDRQARFARSFYAAGQQVVRASVNLIYPLRCAFCECHLDGSPEISLCGQCKGELAPEGLVQCRRCAATINPFERTESDCVRCRKERFRFDRVLALARYTGSLRDAVLHMKRSHAEPLMMAIGRVLVERFGDELNSLRHDVVVPIPMHWTRRLVRGTNSPELLGQVVARALGIEFGPRSLRRRRRTQKLAELTRQERKRTLRDAFAVGRGCAFAGARVLLVDDVLTTGTTCDTAAQALRKAGAAEVTVLVVARAYQDE